MKVVGEHEQRDGSTIGCAVVALYDVVVAMVVTTRSRSLATALDDDDDASDMRTCVLS